MTPLRKWSWTRSPEGIFLQRQTGHLVASVLRVADEADPQLLDEIVAALNEKEAREAREVECRKCGHPSNGHWGRPKGCDYVIAIGPDRLRCGCPRSRKIIQEEAR